MSSIERSRRAAQSAASLQALLYTRKQAGVKLGGVSIATVRRLEQQGLLHPIRLTRSPTGQVFIRAAELEALVDEAE